MEIALYGDGGSLFVWIHKTKAIHIDRKLLSLALGHRNSKTYETKSSRVFP